MTPQDTNASASAADDVEHVEAGAPEDTVTPAMIASGLEVLYASGIIENEIKGVDRAVVRQIFLAMIHARRP